MADTEHIYTPQDDSLAERIRAYRSVHEAYANAEASLNLLDNDEWADRLGEKQEIEQAYKICRHSLQIASQSISQNELQQARRQDLISDEEVRELIQNKRQSEMQGLRDNQEADSSEHSNKQ
ncbi:MAG: hypothetical protein OQK32_01925 [Gammaproteobacteria bacterium]|nr:hypothetical protein [Gammaproteobacteria bacterium]